MNRESPSKDGTITTGVGLRAWPSVSHMLGMDVRDLFIILMRQFLLFHAVATVMEV